MCGDGANDCGALKAAHVGISLSETESSVASPLTSKEDNISCVPLVVREGRAALVTSFGVFKCMLCYSLTEFTSVMILYGIDSNLTSVQFLFIDIFLVLNFASVFGKTKAYTGPLFKTPPMTSLLSLVPLASILSHMVVIVAFQVAAYALIQGYEWFKPFVYNPDAPLKYSCYENYSVYSLSMFQYIAAVIAFSKGEPYRKPIYTNKLLSFSLFFMTLVCTYITVYPSDWVLDLFEIKLPPHFDVRTALLALAAGNLACCLVAEDFVVEYLVRKTIHPWLKGVRRKRDARDDDIQRNMSWPLIDCDIKTVIVDETEEAESKDQNEIRNVFENESNVTATTRV